MVRYPYFFVHRHQKDAWVPQPRRSSLQASPAEQRTERFFLSPHKQTPGCNPCGSAIWRASKALDRKTPCPVQRSDAQGRIRSLAECNRQGCLTPTPDNEQQKKEHCDRIDQIQCDHNITNPHPFTLFGVHVEANGSLGVRSWGELHGDNTKSIDKQNVPLLYQELTARMIVWVSNSSMMRAADAVDHYVPRDLSVYTTDSAVLFAVRKLPTLTAYLVLAKEPLVVLLYLVPNAELRHTPMYRLEPIARDLIAALGNRSVMDWCDDMLWYALRNTTDPNPLLSLFGQPVGPNSSEYSLLYGAKADFFNTMPAATFGHLRRANNEQIPAPVSRTVAAAADLPDWTLVRSAGRGRPPLSARPRRHPLHRLRCHWGRVPPAIGHSRRRMQSGERPERPQYVAPCGSPYRRPVDRQVPPQFDAGHGTVQQQPLPYCHPGPSRVAVRTRETSMSLGMEGTERPINRRCLRRAAQTSIQHLPCDQALRRHRMPAPVLL